MRLGWINWSQLYTSIPQFVHNLFTNYIYMVKFRTEGYVTKHLGNEKNYTVYIVSTIIKYKTC